MGLQLSREFSPFGLEIEMKLYSNSRFNSDEIAEAVEKHRREHGDCHFENIETANPAAPNANLLSSREKKAGWPRSPNSYRRVASTKALKLGDK